MGKPKRYNTKDLTNHLRQLAAEAHDWSEDDGVITRGEALARLLWRKALGYTETKINDEGAEVEVVHEPAAWAMQMVYERMEGKTPQAITEDEARITAAERVRELAASRLNSLAKKATAENPVPLKAKGPPRRKKADDAE
jgi:hypothetical protein